MDSLYIWYEQLTHRLLIAQISPGHSQRSHTPKADMGLHRYCNTHIGDRRNIKLCCDRRERVASGAAVHTGTTVTVCAPRCEGAPGIAAHIHELVGNAKELQQRQQVDWLGQAELVLDIIHTCPHTHINTHANRNMSAHVSTRISGLIPTHISMQVPTSMSTHMST